MAGVAAGAIVMSASAAWAQSKPITVEPQPLMSALHDFGSQTGVQILYAPEILKEKVSSGVVGAENEQSALTTILAGTGLTFRREASAYVIVRQGEGGSSPQGASAEDVSAVEELIVTAQKKEEAIQDVPIAISAFTQKSLDAQKIEGGFDLLKAIPNVTFSKSNFSGYNFSIRGVGTKAVSATTDPGVAVAFNNSTLIVNRLFEQEYFDVERVEVLRGPQGTLYGRNATSGVINVISARPRLGEFEGDLKLEAGNYNAKRVRGMINIPMGDTLALRVAGAFTKRDGYGFNEAAASSTTGVRADVDGRDLFSTRVTVGWEPIEQVRVNALWEHFEEDDNRVRTSKQLCYHDSGPQTVGENFEWGDDVLWRAMTSQGCLPGPLDQEGAFGTPNGASLPYVSALFIGPSFGVINGIAGLGGNPEFMSPDARCAASAGLLVVLPIDPCNPDPYGGLMQSRDIRTINSLIEPTYRAKADILELNIDMELGEGLTLTSQTVFSKDEYYASQDYNRYATLPVFSDSLAACNTMDIGFGIPFPDCSTTGTYAGGYYADILPNGYFTDPQLGRSNTLVGQDLSQANSEQFNQEFRLVSNYEAPFNFSIGANYTRFETLNDYYVFLNAVTLLTNVFPFNTHDVDCENNPIRCVYVDNENPSAGIAGINGEGHNYFRSANPYELTSTALFGELYWQASDTVKVTVGARMTWDQKIFTPVPSQLLLSDYRRFVAEGAPPEDCTFGGAQCELAGTGINGRGSPALPDIIQEWREPTGRVIVDWSPDLAFTDETMVYGSIAHGYKGGGANPPNIAPPAGIFNARNSGGINAPTFDPEFVDAFEVGTKNTLLGGRMVLNAAAFFYDYKGYQVSKIVDRSAANENFDAKIWGAELEWVFSPLRSLRFNGTLGYLQTEIGDGQRSLDLMDRTQGGRHGSWIDANGVEHALGYDQWSVIKPWIASSSNCVVPTEVLEAVLLDSIGNLINLCPGGGVFGLDYRTTPVPGLGVTYNPTTEAPNGGAGFFAEVGGHELPNAPHWTASIGAQYRFSLFAGWEGTARVDHYWQDESFARVYNTEYDRLNAWQNTNLSVWIEQGDWGVTAEVYVKNIFDEEPVTDAFLNSDDSGLTTNIFTLDPRLVGLSIRKTF